MPKVLVTRYYQGDGIPTLMDRRSPSAVASARRAVEIATKVSAVPGPGGLAIRQTVEPGNSGEEL